MRLKAARNERHVKPCAEPWHSLLTLRTPVLLLLLSARFSFLFFPPQCMTWPAQPRLGWIVQFHTCLLCWHLSEHIFPASTFPSTSFCISSTPIRRVSFPTFARGGTRGTPSGSVARVLRRATGFRLEIDQSSAKKKVAQPRKHLDNCLLQHEKQLEVSRSWEQRG